MKERQFFGYFIHKHFIEDIFNPVNLVFCQTVLLVAILTDTRIVQTPLKTGQRLCCKKVYRA